MLYHQKVCDIKSLFLFSSIILGGTPIARVLREVLHSKKQEIQERNLLILIATDGVPTDDQGHTDVSSLKKVLKHKRNPINRIPVTIIACTGNENIQDKSMKFVYIYVR